MFRRLDACAERRLVWLSAPAGYGKTTAVVTYLRAREVVPAWYQCDAGDADIASFFHYCSLALRAVAGERAPSVQDFGARDLTAVAAYARVFFRAWFSSLPPGTCWVLDNWQDVPADSSLAALMPLICEQIPDGLKVMVISRSAPPANLSRLATGSGMVIVGEPELRLSREDTAAVLALSRQPGDQPRVLGLEEWYDATEGWVAGVTLLQRVETEHSASGATLSPRLMRGVFDLFATEVFGRLTPELRTVLLHTACLAQVAVPVAEHLLESSHVREDLDALVYQNAFTTHRSASDTYHYHPLFLRFLRSRLRAELGQDEVHARCVAAARALARAGERAQAIELLLRVDEGVAAAALIVGVAPAMVEAGSEQQLRGWIQALPPAVQASSGWIRYWHGIVQMSAEFSAARTSFEAAHGLFVDHADTLGQMLAIAGVLQHLAYGDEEPNALRPWAERLAALLHPATAFPSSSVELQVKGGLLLALSRALPLHPALTDCIHSVSRLLDEPAERIGHLAGVVALACHYGIFGHTFRYRALGDRLAALLAQPDLAPVVRVQILWVNAHQGFLCGATDESVAQLEVAEKIARSQQLKGLEARIRLLRMQMCECKAHRGELGAAFSALAPQIARASPRWAGQARQLCALYLLADGQRASSFEAFDDAFALFDASGQTFDAAATLVGKAVLCVEMDRLDRAQALLERSAQLLAGFDAPAMEFQRRLVAAEIARRSGCADRFAAALSAALILGRAHDFANTVCAYDVLLPGLIPWALKLGIEVDYCCEIISRRRLAPPTADVPHWPYPVRIRATGHLDVYVDGVLIESPGRTQRRPMDLLKRLVMRSAGVDCVRLMDSLWPDVEGDAARNAFDLALHRLRKLLKHKDAIVLSRGRLLLNPRVVWVDAFMLERLSAERWASRDLDASVGQLMTLYRAPLLIEEESPDVFDARARLRSQFIRAAASLVEQLDQAGLPNQVASLCRQALEIEPLEESLYRAWIRSLLAQGHEAEATAVYRRCAETLSVRLQTQPSRTTRELLGAARGV